MSEDINEVYDQVESKVAEAVKLLEEASKLMYAAKINPQSYDVSPATPAVWQVIQTQAA